MFLKLLKYDLKSVGKWYLGLYAACVLLSAFLGFWIRATLGNPNETMTQEPNSAMMVLLIFSILAVVAVYIALWISTLVVIVTHFKNNIFGRQGYLTMTLPVTTHQIISSKLVTALIWSFLSSLVTIASVLLVGLIVTSGTWDQIQEGWQGFWQGFLGSYPDPTNLVSPFTYSLYTLVSSIAFVLVIYFAISLGHTAENHRLLFSFIAYALILFALNIISTFISLNFNNGDQSLNILDNSYNWIAIVYNLIIGVSAYFGTHYLVKHKLNLQ